MSRSVNAVAWGKMKKGRGGEERGGEGCAMAGDVIHRVEWQQEHFSTLMATIQIHRNLQVDPLHSCLSSYRLTFPCKCHDGFNLWCKRRGWRTQLRWGGTRIRGRAAWTSYFQELLTKTTSFFKCVFPLAKPLFFLRVSKTLGIYDLVSWYIKRVRYLKI